MSKPYELRVLDYLRNYREVAARVKEVVKSIEPSARVFVFGPVVRGRYTALSDMDILVIVENTGRKQEILTRVYREVETTVELHVVTRELYEKWYRRFIDLSELVKI